MSRIFKSNYVKIGTPKAIKSNIPPIPKKEQPASSEPVSKMVNEEEQAKSIIQDARDYYLKIIQEANSEAKNVLEQANQEKETIQNLALEEGYKEGYNSGYAEGINQAQGIINQASEIKQQLNERIETLMKDAENQIIGMVLEIANKVVGQELTQNNEVIMSLIRQSIAKCAFKDKLVIRVSEADYNYVCDNKERIVMLTEGINDLEICCDKALPKGGCIVDTPSGEINASINIQMREIERAFEYLIRNE